MMMTTNHIHSRVHLFSLIYLNIIQTNIYNELQRRLTDYVRVPALVIDEQFRIAIIIIIGVVR